MSGPWTGDGEALPAGYLHHDDGPPGPGFAAGGAMDTLAGRPTLPASPTTPPTTRRRLTTTESSELTPGSSPASTRGRQPAAEGGPPASRTAWRTLERTHCPAAPPSPAQDHPAGRSVRLQISRATGHRIPVSKLTVAKLSAKLCLPNNGLLWFCQTRPVAAEASDCESPPT